MKFVQNQLKMLKIALHLTVLLPLASCIKHTKPVIVFKQDVRSFTITKGEVFTTNFEFSNSGTDSLEIKNVTASCGCTEVNLSMKKIAPNDTAKVTVTYDNKTDNKQIGRFEKVILIESNTTPILHTLYLRGNVIN